MKKKGKNSKRQQQQNTHTHTQRSAAQSRAHSLRGSEHTQREKLTRTTANNREIGNVDGVKQRIYYRVTLRRIVVVGDGILNFIVDHSGRSCGCSYYYNNDFFVLFCCCFCCLVSFRFVRCVVCCCLLPQCYTHSWNKYSIKFSH